MAWRITRQAIFIGSPHGLPFFCLAHDLEKIRGELYLF